MYGEETMRKKAVLEEAIQDARKPGHGLKVSGKNDLDWIIFLSGPVIKVAGSILTFQTSAANGFR